MMVDIIMAREGVVDKFIGDAIMAIFGAPVSHGNDALASVISGLEMTEALGRFNAEQKRLGAPEFKIGVGVNYGEVTVGNIGCEKKMNYTVIGDMVNLASRLEGLTKRYHQPILITQDTAEAMGNELPARIVDKVAVKGKTEGVKIYTVRRTIADVEAKAWGIHEEAVKRYYARDFTVAAEGFRETLALLPDDYPATLFLERSLAFAASPPPADWDGVEIMTEK
jgi:adenylate cyclase